MGLALNAGGAAGTMRGAQLSAQGEILAGQAASQSDIYNAGVEATNAQIFTQGAVMAGQAGEAQAGISEAGTRAQVGGIKAQQGASGIDLDSESVSDVRASAASVGKLDAMTIRANAAKTAYGLETEATSSTAASGLSKAKASYDVTAANLQSRATVLSGATKAAGGFGQYLLTSGLTGGK